MKYVLSLILFTLSFIASAAVMQTNYPAVDVAIPYAGFGPNRCGGPVTGSVPATSQLTYTWTATMSGTDVIADFNKTLTINSRVYYSQLTYNSVYKYRKCYYANPAITQVVSYSSSGNYQTIKPFVYEFKTLVMPVRVTGLLNQTIIYNVGTVLDANGVVIPTGSVVAPGTYTHYVDIDASAQNNTGQVVVNLN